MTIGHICQRSVDVADGNETVQAAAQRMGARAVGSLVVVDRENRPIGILTDRDLAIQVVGRGHDPQDIKVKELATTEVLRVSEDVSTRAALDLMLAEGVRRLPVVDADDKLVGVVSLDDVVGLLAAQLGQVGELLEKLSPRHRTTK